MAIQQAKTRKKRIHSIEKFIREKGPMTKEKVIGKIQYDWGFRKEKAEEYISVLERVGKISMEGSDEGIVVEATSPKS